jgi:DNA-binding LacI/PurR family transcriptional regulator
MGAQAIIGIDLLGADSTSIYEMVNALQATNKPSLAIVDGPLAVSLPHIFHHHYDMGYLAAEALLRNGYLCQTFVTPFEASWVNGRIEGARMAISNKHNPLASLSVFNALSPENWRNEQDSGESIMRVTKELMRHFIQDRAVAKSRYAGPPGFIAANDIAAYAILESLAEKGMILGRDFGLIGFDASPLSRMGHFSSVRPSFEVLGKIAGSMIMQAIQGNPLSLHTRVQPEIVQRTPIKRYLQPSTHIGGAKNGAAVV